MIEEIKKRLSILEQGREMEGEKRKLPFVFTLPLVLPRIELSRMLFNRTEVSAVFDRKMGGWYYSRHVLFYSARNVWDSSKQDILTEYLNLSASDYRDGDPTFKSQVAEFFNVSENEIEVSLPSGIEGGREARKYNITVRVPGSGLKSLRVVVRFYA